MLWEVRNKQEQQLHIEIWNLNITTLSNIIGTNNRYYLNSDCGLILALEDKLELSTCATQQFNLLHPMKLTIAKHY